MNYVKSYISLLIVLSLVSSSAYCSELLLSDEFQQTSSAILVLPTVAVCVCGLWLVGRCCDGCERNYRGGQRQRAERIMWENVNRQLDEEEELRRLREESARKQREDLDRKVKEGVKTGVVRILEIAQEQVLENGIKTIRGLLGL